MFTSANHVFMSPVSAVKILALQNSKLLSKIEVKHKKLTKNMVVGFKQTGTVLRDYPVQKNPQFEFNPSLKGNGNNTLCLV